MFGLLEVARAVSRRMVCLLDDVGMAIIEGRIKGKSVFHRWAFSRSRDSALKGMVWETVIAIAA